MKWWIVTLGVLGSVFLAGLIFVLSIISMYNNEANLLNTYESKVQANQAEFDNMKKKISQVVQVSDMQLEKLKDVFVSYAQARSTDSQNVMMNWIKESVPNVDTDIYKKIVNIITASRDSWTTQQKELVDLSREYNKKLVVFPSNLILPLFGFKKIEPKIITSSATQQAFETGQDNDVKLH